MKKEFIERKIVEEAKKREKGVGFSELVSKSDVNSPYGIGFIDGSVWMMQQFQWISVEDKLPPKDLHDWVLIRVTSNSGMELVPEIAEIRSDGYWHTKGSDYKIGENFEEILRVKVTHWLPFTRFNQK